MTFRTSRRTLRLGAGAFFFGGLLSCSDLLGFEEGMLAPSPGGDAAMQAPDAAMAVPDASWDGLVDAMGDRAEDVARDTSVKPEGAPDGDADAPPNDTPGHGDFDGDAPPRDVSPPDAPNAPPDAPNLPDASLDAPDPSPDAPLDAQPDLALDVGADVPARDSGPTCNATTCPGGCCDASGACVQYPSQTGDACGTAGNACVRCATGQACNGGACRCGSATCAGCCANDQCQTSNDDHCGAGGGVCTVCTATQDCSAEGQCVCTPSSCPNGCCDTSGVCQMGTTTGACGAGGAMCQACGNGQTCGSGQCVCNATSCPTGCCNGSSCVPYASQNDASCGVAGAACAMCATGQSCAKSSAGCVTWCGLRAAPSGVAAGDYACLDFDTGLPPGGTWPATIEAPSTLSLITATAASLPHAIEPVCLIGQGGGDAVFTWTAAPSGSAVRRISISAAINPYPPQQGSTSAEMHILCGVLDHGFESRGCLSHVPNQGLSLSYRFFYGDTFISGSCPLTTAVTPNIWTTVELRFDTTTGLLEATIGDNVSTCQPEDAPVATTIPKAKVGLFAEQSSDIGFATRLDNVVVSVQR